MSTTLVPLPIDRRRTSEDDAPTPTVPSRPTWWDQAKCNTQDQTLVALFFSEKIGDIARAKMICADCPALATCLEGALERREPWGVWGGQLFVEGRIIAQKRPRGRPRKVPRPEDKLPEIPIPEHLLPVSLGYPA